MAIYSGLITPAGTAAQVASSLSIPAGAYARKIEIEPLRGNANAGYVGGSNVTDNGTGAAWQELAAPATSTPLDRFTDQASGDDHNLDPTAYYVNASAGTFKATVWTI